MKFLTQISLAIAVTKSSARKLKIISLRSTPFAFGCEVLPIH